jgi:hypothetical protein
MPVKWDVQDGGSILRGRGIPQGALPSLLPGKKFFPVFVNLDIFLGKTIPMRLS